MKKQAGFISKVEDLKANMLKFPTVELQFLCPECFETVRCSTMENGCKACWCGCYARIFEPEKLANMGLDQSAWLAYIKASANYKLVKGLNSVGADMGDLQSLPIINGLAFANYDIWCPACERNRKMAAKGIWVDDNGKYICTYGVCASCATRQQKANEEEASKLVDVIEERLLFRYPNLI